MIVWIKKGYKLTDGSTTNAESRSMYQQPPEQRSKHNSSFEHNIPQSQGPGGKRRRYLSGGWLDDLRSTDLNRPGISENQAQKHQNNQSHMHLNPYQGMSPTHCNQTIFRVNKTRPIRVYETLLPPNLISERQT